MMLTGGRLGLMGDVGQTADSKATLQHLVASAPQSILDVGDISYAGMPTGLLGR